MNNTQVNTTVLRAGIFKSEAGNTAILVSLADGQTYRVTTSEPTQLRIGMEGLQQAFPELLPLTPAKAAVKVAKGAINGLPVSYVLTDSKKLDSKGKPYTNVRLVSQLANARDEDILALLDIGGAYPAITDQEGNWGEPAN